MIVSLADTIRDAGKLFTGLVGFIGVLTLILGQRWCLKRLTTSKFILIPFSLALLAYLVFYTLTSSVMIMVGSEHGTKLVKDTCNDIKVSSITKTLWMTTYKAKESGMYDLLAGLDYNVTDALNQHMCSQYCSCSSVWNETENIGNRTARSQYNELS